MNKDEMIEEMAKVLCDKDKRCEECISRLLLPCGYKSYCTKLYNAGYRKVGEDEMVFSKDLVAHIKQETAIDIISIIIDDDGADLNKIARKYGIELE